ncbi:MAG: hypothetical protein QW303_05155 [Nitrososphaerota archaeon]
MENSCQKINSILLVDSSLTLKIIKPYLKKLNQKIISLDYQSHRLLLQHKVIHEISDSYISEKELDKIQNLSYQFVKWYENPEISELIKYDEINT